MRILSVDDQAENLFMLEALLRGHGHVVDSASNGLDALKLAERGVYDLVISDILMPRMDGFQLCREMKRDERLRQIPFVFYTATYTDPRDASFALSLGADRFLVKPLEPEAFIREVDEVVSKKMPSPPPTGAEPEDEAIYLKEYNARLISKLEKKMLDLEAANRLLQEDISERERTAKERAKFEDKLRQAQKLEAIGTLAGGIAHDFNNILAGIIGFADLGIQEAADPSASTASFQQILKAGGRARDLVRQILAFSRHREQDRKPLDLQADIVDTLKLLRATLPASVEIVTAFEPQTPMVLADSIQIHQVVTNLVTNAWHAIGDRAGQIRLQLATFNVDADFARTQPDLRPGRYVRLSISDNGSGMDSATVSRIFEPFFTTKEPGRGTGLGLSVVHGIMKSCDGAIAVYSAPNDGTTFHLYFPALDLDTPAADVSEPALSFGHGQSILFIDDEPVLATLGERFLTRLGYTSVIESDANAALEVFRERPFDLVITDLTMPQYSGIDLARRLWEIRPGARVVLTTGYSATLDSPRAREIGFRELLLKPYNIQALGDCVKRALAG
jgi:CheY-like chemotaxis protein